eukprot:14439848-Alexandrium_andersonii.AAC.1
MSRESGVGDRFAAMLGNHEGGSRDLKQSKKDNPWQGGSGSVRPLSAEKELRELPHPRPHPSAGAPRERNGEPPQGEDAS